MSIFPLPAYQELHIRVDGILLQEPEQVVGVGDDAHQVIP